MRWRRTTNAGHDHSSHAEEGVDAHFLTALIPVTMEGQEGIDEAHSILQEMQGSNLLHVSDGESLAPSTESGYELFFSNPESTTSVRLVDLDQESYVLFLPATPSQVSAEGVHFLVDEEGFNVWPVTARYFEEPDPRDGSKPWGEVIGATLLINVVTLIGVIFLVPTLSTAFKNKSMGQALNEMTHSSNMHLVAGKTKKMFDMCITAFACGALLATTVFLIVPEALVLVNAEEPGEGEDPHAGHNHRMLQDDHEGHDHGTKNWVFGTFLCVLHLDHLPQCFANYEFLQWNCLLT